MTRSTGRFVALTTAYAFLLVGGLILLKVEGGASGAALMIWAAASFAYGFITRARWGFLLAPVLAAGPALLLGSTGGRGSEEIPLLLFAGAAMPVAMGSVLAGVALRGRVGSGGRSEPRS